MLTTIRVTDTYNCYIDWAPSVNQGRSEHVYIDYVPDRLVTEFWHDWDYTETEKWRRKIEAALLKKAKADCIAEHGRLPRMGCEMLVFQEAIPNDPFPFTYWRRVWLTNTSGSYSVAIR